MKYRKKLIFISAVVISVFTFQIYYMIPDKVLLQEGENYDFPPMISTFSGKNGTQLRLFGVLPLRTVKVNIVEKTELIPCGNTIGIRININGIMVVGMSDIRNSNGKKCLPAQSAGLREGDVIKKINNKEVTKITQLTQIINNSNGESLDITVERDNQTLSLKITPSLSNDDNSYKIGAWVRDNTSGIGTITYINPKNNRFGALGHGITDVDTGKIIPAGYGDILHSKIISVKKGERGSPGELRGVFSGTEKVGIVEENTEIGIYGRINKLISNNEPMPVGMRSQVRLGNAHILSNIESDKVEKYDVEIQKIMKNAINNKGMVVKITDERLLKKTGGIVQGMSGSPIIQDGKLIGAVTHVFINDPTRGYGTFIELMLNNTFIDQ